MLGHRKRNAATLAPAVDDRMRFGCILEPLMFANWLVTHREVNTDARIRVVFDLLVAESRGR